MYLTASHALTAESLEGQICEMADRVEICDALYRFGFGQDLQHRDLLASAFAADAELDFRPAARRWGMEPPVMRGGEVITDTILAMFRDRVDTTHVVTNPRISISGDTAELTAIVEAQHLLTEDHSVHALLKNLYSVSLARDDRRWTITRMRIENVWYTGTPEKIFS